MIRIFMLILVLGLSAAAAVDTETAFAQSASAVIMQDQAGALFVPGAGENVRVVQAALSTTGGFDNGGSGMTVSKPEVGTWVITTVFPTAGFPATGKRPTVLCSVRDFNVARFCTYVNEIVGDFWQVTVVARNLFDTRVDTDVSVVMIGNR